MSAANPLTSETRWPLFVVRIADGRCLRQVSLGNDDQRVTFFPLGRAHLFDSEHVARLVLELIEQCAPDAVPLIVEPVTEEEVRKALADADVADRRDEQRRRRWGRR